MEECNCGSCLWERRGGQPVKLTVNEGFDRFPSRSPDGAKMLLTVKHPAELEVFTCVMEVFLLAAGPGARGEN